MLLSIGKIVKERYPQALPSGHLRLLGSKDSYTAVSRQLETMETMGSPGTEREPTPRPSIKLRKHARQIRVRAGAAHVRRVGRAVLVLAKIVPFAPSRVRKHRVSFGDQLELFLIAALETKHRSVTWYVCAKTRALNSVAPRGGPGAFFFFFFCAPCPDDA
jgi:hypothetical protein